MMDFFAYITSNESSKILLGTGLIIVFTTIFGLFLKDLAAGVAAGLRWKIKKDFEPGSIVFLDGERATIISIGYRETIFEIDNGRGKVWRYIDNVRIPYHRLERIIESKKNV